MSSRANWRALNANGLPGGLEWEEFVAFSSRFRYLQNIAGTRPPQLLKWSGRAGSSRARTGPVLPKLPRSDK